MKILTLGFGLVLSWILSSCASTGYVARVDDSLKLAEVQSHSDKGSAIYSLQKRGILSDLESSLRTAVAKDKTDIKSLINLSQVHLAKGDLKEAENYCRSALKYDLDNTDAKLTLAQIYYRRGLVDMTEIILNSLGDKVSKDSVALNLKGLVALKNDRPSYAMNFFRTALKYNSGDIATRMNLGVLYVYYRQVDLAAIEFERVLRSMPKHVDARLHLAVIEASRGQYDKAEDIYRDVLSIDSGNALATLNLAFLEEKRQNYSNSMDHLKDYLKTDYAKRKENKEVFAMIDRLKAKKESRDASLSDSDLKSLANLPDQPKVSPKSGKIVSDRTKDSVKNPPAKAAAAPKKSVKKQIKTKPPSDDIESLEKALLGD